MTGYVKLLHHLCNTPTDQALHFLLHLPPSGGAQGVPMPLSFLVPLSGVPLKVALSFWQKGDQLLWPCLFLGVGIVANPLVLLPLEVCSSQMPVIVLRGLMLLLQAPDGAEGGRGFVVIWQIFLTQGLLQC